MRFYLSQRSPEIEMIKILCLFLIFNSVAIGSDNDALAPHPLYWTVDGSPSYVKVGNNGTAVYVVWNGKELIIMDKPPKPPKRTTFLGSWGCWGMFLFGIIAWYLIIKGVIFAVREIWRLCE